MRAVVVVMLSGCGFQLSLSDAPVADDAAVDAVVDGDVDAAPIDAAPIDAPLLVCPASYTVTITATTSRYRFRKSGGRPGPSAGDCANDGTGTHIVSLDSLQEIQQLHAAAVASGGWAIEQIDHPNDTLIWVGGVQLPNQSNPGANWITVTGATLPPSWGAGEPNDFALTNNTEDGEEQLLVFYLERQYLADIIDEFDFGVICECDGLEPAATFTAAFEAQD
jgi:hypothetical protein